VLDFLPSLQRRRLSDLSKLALWAAFDCAGPAAVRTVFASPHGEIQRTQALLANLAAAEPLSPTAFSLSVHNTASGLYSIASNNCEPSTAIAAGADTLALAVVEAAGALQHCERVLVVFADEPLPAHYTTASRCEMPHALALLLEKSAAGPRYTLASSATLASDPVLANGAAAASVPAESPALSAIRWLCDERRELHVPGERRGWLWSRR
jgi:hypothetical protein